MGGWVGGREEDRQTCIWVGGWVGGWVRYLSHRNLRTTSSRNGARLSHRGGQHTERIVKRAFSLVQQVGGRTSENDGAGSPALTPGETNEFVFSNQDFWGGWVGGWVG